jgi:hypothetical protein
VTAVLPAPERRPVEAETPLLPAPAAGPARAAWIFALALDLATEGGVDESAVAGLVDQAGGSRRALEGAYGRAVALVAEYPNDPKVRQTLEILVRALRRLHRPLA